MDLAAGRALPLNAHHAHMHTGRAGEAIARTETKFVVPTAGLTPWADCAEFKTFFPG